MHHFLRSLRDIMCVSTIITICELWLVSLILIADCEPATRAYIILGLYAINTAICAIIEAHDCYIDRKIAGGRIHG